MAEKTDKSVIEKIQDICSKIEGYTFVFGAEHMKNIIADKPKLPCVYLEEYREGMYNTGSYQQILPFKDTRIEVYFINTIDASSFTVERLAFAREKARNVLEKTGVFKFMEKFNEATLVGDFKSVSDWKFYIPKPLFDENNEVSIMLQINCEEEGC